MRRAHPPRRPWRRRRRCPSSRRRACPISSLPPSVGVVVAAPPQPREHECRGCPDGCCLRLSASLRYLSSMTVKRIKALTRRAARIVLGGYEEMYYVSCRTAISILPASRAAHGTPAGEATADARGTPDIACDHVKRFAGIAPHSRTPERPSAPGNGAETRHGSVYSRRSSCTAVLNVAPLSSR